MEQHNEYEIDLRDIFKIIRKHILLIMAIPLIAIIITGIAVFYVINPTYEAVTTLMVTQAITAETQISAADISLNRQLVQTYREIARSRTVMTQVAEQLNLTSIPTDTDVTQRGNTEVIQVSVQHTDPQLAQIIAQVTAEVFMSRVQELMRIDNVNIVDTAIVPTSPVKPKKTLTIAIAAVLGGMISLGLAFLLEYLDNTVKTPADVERLLGLSILGTIPKEK